MRSARANTSKINDHALGKRASRLIVTVRAAWHAALSCLPMLSLFFRFSPTTSPGELLDLADRGSSSEDPRSDRQDLVGFLEIVFGAEQPDVRRREAAAAFRIRNVMIEVEVFGRAALDALTTIAAPDFDLHRRWNQAIVREFDDATE
jgi:hypothetical protein